MASLYEQLMASKGAPKAAAATNSTQLRKAPVSLRSAMRKYAAGGDVTNDTPDYSRAYGALGGAGVVNDLRNQFLNMGVDENTIGSIFSKYYAPETSQPTPQALTPPPPPPEPPPEPPLAPRYEEPRRPINPDLDTPYIAPQQPQGPQTSYRMNDDGSRTEIGYDGQPIANYTPEQLAMHNATTGVTPPEYRYVWNGEGYTKVPNGPQNGYNPEPEMPRPDPQTRYEDPRKEQEAEEGRRKQEAEDLRREQESIARQREAEEYYFRMRNAQSEQPRYEEPIAPTMPYYPEEPMPETYIEPEVNFPEDPSYYQRPVDYYNPSPPMDFTQDPGFAPTPTPIGIAKSLQGGDIGKLLQDLTSRSGGQQSEGLAALIAKALASGGGGGSLEEQRRLMSLLEMLKGR